MLKCYHPRSHPQTGPQQLPEPPNYQPPAPPQPPRRHDSFSDWLQNESYQLQKKGNMYRVNEPNAKKSVRFTEPDKEGKKENEYSVDPTATTTSLPVVTSPSDFYADIAHFNQQYVGQNSGNVGRTSTFESPAHTYTNPAAQLPRITDGSLV